MQRVVLLAPCGPNPAPVAELAWALAVQRGLLATDAFLVVESDKAAGWLEVELLGDGAALGALRARIPGVLARVHARPVRLPGGGTAADERDPALPAAYAASFWEAARDALSCAGDDPVIFGLTGGRLRTSTAYPPAVFQLLARPGDRLIDVWVSERAVEGASGFFFPDQPRQLVAGAIRASDVRITLIDVPVPRLRPLLSEADLASYDHAVAAGERAVGVARRPRLAVDIAAGEVRVDGALLPLTRAHVVWYAARARARVEGAEWVDATDLGAVRREVERIPCFKREDLRRALLDHLGGGLPKYDLARRGLDDLKKLRCDTHRRVGGLVRALPNGALLKPQTRQFHAPGRRHRARIPLEPEWITVV